MHGYETKQQRESHIKALVTEQRDVKHAIGIAEAKLKELPDDQRVERAWREEEIAKLKATASEVEEQLRLFKGDAPHKRATKRDTADEKRA